MLYSEQSKKVLTAFIYRHVKTDMLTFVKNIGIDNNLSLVDVTAIILDSSNIKCIKSYFYNNDINRLKRLYNERVHSLLMEIVFKQYDSGLIKKDSSVLLHETMGSTLFSKKNSTFEDLAIRDFCSHMFKYAIEIGFLASSDLSDKYKDNIVTVLDPSIPLFNKNYYLNKLTAEDMKVIKDKVENFFADFIVYAARFTNNRNLEILIRYTDSVKDMITSNYIQKSVKSPVNNTKNVESDTNIKDPDSLIVEMMLDSGLFRFDWARLFYGSTRNLQTVVNKVKVKNPELYARYQEHIEKEKELVNKLIDVVYYYLNNGVKLADGTSRRFTIIDYYSLTTLSVESLDIMTKGLKMDADKFRALKTFISSNVRSSHLTEEQALGLNFYMTIGSEKRNLLLEEKRAIIAYLKEYEIPLRSNTYSTLVREYAHGRILIPQINNEKTNGIR